MPTKAHRLDLSGLANMRTVRSVRIRMPAIEREREENGKRTGRGNAVQIRMLNVPIRSKEKTFWNDPFPMLSCDALVFHSETYNLPLSEFYRLHYDASDSVHLNWRFSKCIS